MKSTTMTITGLYLFTAKNFKDMEERIYSYVGKNDMNALLKEEIIFNGELMQLYMISTQTAEVMFFAHAASTMDGNFVKNRFSGTFGNNQNLPTSIGQLFQRHITAV
jgi:hypothetical protein